MTRTSLTAAALAALTLAAPTAALAGSGMHTERQSTLKAPSAVPVAIHGTGAKAIKHSGDKLDKGQSLMRTKVSGPAHKGIQLRFTCPSGAVTGYGYKGPDALALNGKKLMSQHTVRPKVQAAADRNHDGRFTGVVYAFCEGGH